jgi:protein gp37
MARRLKATGSAKYANGFTVTLHEDVLDHPVKWNGRHSIFICSMSDIFHDRVPFAFVDKVLDTVRKTPRHHYQILTKRVNRMSEYFSSRRAPENLWLGATVESSSETARIAPLSRLDANIRFLSCEPLLDDLGEIDLSGIDWVIAGGESGVRGRPMKPEWLRSLLRQARTQNVPFYFKQWGAWGSDGIKRSKKTNGNSLDGKIIQMMPQARHTATADS